MTDLSKAAKMALDVWTTMTAGLPAEERQRISEIVGGFGPPEPDPDTYRDRECLAIDRALKKLQARKKGARDRAKAAGREGVSHCRQSDFETLAHVRQILRERRAARRS